ncbi:PAS domain S-box protein [Thiohalocapsa marina]|uniref:PAS domain S-box protein n=1 Tax=Thiohalocapsa marina TaxID=424902 RepID=UPI0036DB190E|nr:PAS domain S-box protein [Sphingobacteriia bacterium]NCC41063.1 PAS domain S-box protein [Gammaproteobacteria bacterium]
MQILDPGAESIERAVHGQDTSALFEKRYRHRNGHVVHAQVASSLVRDEHGQALYFISQVQDITARKRQEQELHQAREAAEAANRAKSVFLANMSPALPKGARLSTSEVAHRLAQGDEPWRRALCEAVALGDFELISAALAQARGLDDRVRETLTRWIEDYDLDAFVQALR